MEGTAGCERRAAEALVGTLEQMLTELACSTYDRDLAWIRPLAVLSAEIEYSAVRSPEVDSINLADEVRQLSDLLAGSPRDGGEFAARYARAHRASPTIAALHDKALATCRTVAMRHALVRWAA
jgi:hypothetical protein